MPRPSNYRKSYGQDKGKDHFMISPEAKQQKEQEKEKMRKLNNRLVNYVDKVHDLETANKMLVAENARLRKLKKTPENDVSALYEDELRRLREKIELLSSSNTSLEIEKDNLQYDLEETNNKLSYEKELKVEYEEEAKGLRKDVDDATLERSNLETKIENLQEAIQLEKQVHDAEMENLRSQIQPQEAPVLTAEQPSLLTDLNEAIASVRKQYEAFNAKNLEDLDKFYKEKVESLVKQLKAARDEIRELQGENAEKKKRIHELEMELEKLRQKNDRLERDADRLKDQQDNEAEKRDELIKQLQSELENAREDLGKYLIRYQKINNLNVSLEQEIAIYQNVLSGEEERIGGADTSIRQRRSRSSSRSSRSSKSSRSSSSSRERSKDDLVEEMLEENQLESAPGKKEPSTGVISVSWKVKGGTVRPVKPFEPSNDIEILNKAMEGLGTDEDAIIKVLSKRTKIQRQVIGKLYEEKYTENLLKRFEKELSGDFKATVQHMMWKKSELDAQAIRKAMKGLGTDEAVLIEILCTQTSREIREIKEAYSKIFDGRSLEKDVESETSGAFKQFLEAILKANRPPDSGTVVSNLAEEDAQALYDLKVKEWSPSNPVFLQIFTQRSFQHLWYVFKQCWVKLSKENLMETVEKECKGDLKRGLKTLIRFSTCIPPVYYASQLRDCMSSKETEDKQLIYILTTRSEVDLIDIKEEYARLYATPLENSLKDNVSGDYKKMLLALVD